MVLKAINKDKYFLSTVIISLMVAVLIHFPESVSLFDRFESHSLFPGMKFMDVANEILFTFVSLLILFAINTRLFHFNQASIKITAAKILLSFILTWILSNLLGQVFVFLHRTFDIPAIDAWYTITSIRCETSSWPASSPAVAASSTLSAASNWY